ncbi:MAG TPA: ferritin family protein [bacterium]|nr:ferritin family protein [bacterium]
MSVKKGLIALLALATIVAVYGFASPVTAQQKLDQQTQNALTTALNDEYKAQALYAKILAKFGAKTKPFSHIITAEERHIELLKPLLKQYGVAIPANDWADRLSAPATLLEACQQGVVAEKENIKMYDEFLGFVKEKDIRDMFKYLRNASEKNHLPAFERCVDREGDMGRGRGQGQGQGQGRGRGQGGGGYYRR